MYTTTCVFRTFYCIFTFCNACAECNGEKKKLPSFVFSSEESLLHKPGRFQGSCSSSLKLLVETKKIITFTNLIPLSYAYAIWGTSFAGNGFTAASVSNQWKCEQNQIYRSLNSSVINEILNSKSVTGG